MAQMSDFLVKTSSVIGLTLFDSMRAIEMLGGQVNELKSYVF